MDSDKLQKLANLAIVRQHAAAVTASTNFNRKYINKVNVTLSTLDNEFFETLIDAVGEVGAQDTATISQRLAEEKAKLKNKGLQELAKSANDVVTVPDDVVESLVKSESRPSIKTSRVKKDK
jgi:hypothetical protein